MLHRKVCCSFYRFRTRCTEKDAGLFAGRTMLVPLTQSLYVPGRVKEPSRVIVDVGTGYYVEKSLPKAKEFMERKVRKPRHFLCVPK